MTKIPNIYYTQALSIFPMARKFWKPSQPESIVIAWVEYAVKTLLKELRLKVVEKNINMKN